MQDKAQELKLNFWTFCAVCYPCGLSPVAPGTFGSILGVLIAFLGLSPLMFYAGGMSLFYVIAVFLFLLILFGFAWFSIEKSKIYFDQIDDRRIVIDEVVGQLVTLAFVPQLTKTSLFLGFVLFRFFDIYKPWPVSRIDQKMKNSLGVVLDDVVAGIFAALTLSFILYFSAKI